MTRAGNWPDAPHAWLMSAARWLASDLCLELGDRVRWPLMWENHGYNGGRIDHIARRFPLERPKVRPIVDVPMQLTLVARVQVIDTPGPPTLTADDLEAVL